MKPSEYRFPHLFVAGPPKAGTSSLFRWLADHPSAVGSDPKETFVLMDPDHPLARPARDRDRDDFESFFPDLPAEALRVEGTSHTLFQEVALERIASSDAKVLVPLRRPADRVFSSFRYSRDTLGTVDRSLPFSTLVELQTRADGAAIRRVCSSAATAYVLARDLDYSRYSRWVRRWTEAVGEARVEVAWFDDFSRQPTPVLRAIAGWLGIDPAFYDGYPFPRTNPTRRTGKLRVPAPLRKALRGALPERWRRRLTARRGRPPEPPTAEEVRTLTRLDEAFGPDVRELEKLTGRDLAAWTAPRTGGRS